MESATQTMQNLREGNARFVANTARRVDMRKRREELVAGQHPHTSVLTCSDSRVSPEYIFDASLGDLFVVRTAGNVADPIALGSLEYGCEHLHTPILLVMGHSKCGAVKATCDTHGKLDEGHIKDIVAAVDPAAKKKGYSLDESIRANVENSAECIRRQSPIIARLEKEKKLLIVGAVYSLETGAVEFF